ncbi:MAG TPA: tetratricopeptide repeat protein [Thermomicrobiales bacterium]|nr:tetratricopeptide repeat protein [Thermomicrobiales bacterium]
MTLSIAEVMRQAQEEMNGGDFRAASQTCAQLIRQFPGYARAHGMLGEAFREQGQLAGAQRAFAESLARHQRAPGAYLGLGLIAEDQGSTEQALAYCQVAWELAPDQRQLREPLARVAMRRYGADGDLQLSHAALAQMHANASRLRRAVDAFRRALADLPNRVDLKLGMAECLWRMGHDAEAARLAHEALEQFPESAAALAIAADVERRSGSAGRADDLLRQLRAVDPDGVIVASMLATNPRADRGYLELPLDAMPGFGDEVADTPVERLRIAPAPDFEYLPARAELPAASIEELEPISVEEFGGESDALQAAESAPDAFSFDSLGIEGELTPISIEELGGLPEGFQPISPEEFGGMQTDLPATERGDAPPDPAADERAPQPVDEALPFDEASLGFEQASGVDQVVSTRPVTDALGRQATDAPSEPADDLASLAAAIEGDVADALSRADGDAPRQDDIDDSRPPATTPGGYTTVLQSLGDEGFAPFDPRARAAAEAGEAMPSLEMDDQLLEQSRPPSETDDATRITADWDSIDDEILRAMPEGYQPGYTAELRSLDDIGLAPFEIEEQGGEREGIAPFDLFDDEADEADESDSFDAASPAAAHDDALSAANDEPGQAGPDDDQLGGLEPFAFEEFDSADAAPGTGQRHTAWDSSVSAIPSDDDLDTLLAFEDDPEVDIAPAAEAVDAPGVEDRTTPEPRIEDELSRVTPGLDVDKLDPIIEHSIAVTRVLGGEPATSDAQHEAPEAAAEASSAPTSRLTDSLRPGTEVFHRARQIKQGLVSGGVIIGDRELSQEVATDELAQARDSAPADWQDDEAAGAVDAGVDADEDDRIVEFDSALDVSTLRAALELTPDDDQMRWWLAEALREQGELSDAFAEYRWLIRHAPSRHDALLQALNECVDREQSPEMAHRLLGDIYRRHGDTSRASAHAALALQRHKRGVRA